MNNASDRSKKMKAMFGGINPAELAQSVAPSPLSQTGRRVSSGAVRSMQDSFSAIEDENVRLREQLSNAEAIIDIPAERIDPSFVKDRMDDESDPRFEDLVSSMREHGQQVPILVRPHPTAADRYQIAYGHRRWRAADRLARPVKAIVRTLTDDALVVAQGKENTERKDLSFIEQALFAQELKERSFDRQTIAAALGRGEDRGLAYISILTSLASSLPQDLVRRIGPAPKTGRPKWEKLATHFTDRKLPAARSSAANGLMSSEKWQAADSDSRFAMLLAVLESKEKVPAAKSVVKASSGRDAVSIERNGTVTRFAIDDRNVKGLADWLAAKLPELVARFEQDGH
ncbi:plasmid partitioning protein RepB [Sinorhizobium sp. BG8]|uniref:plasmid partitioning protein RepB n=1 Tax=Sinorhizobium sp. BG8 TaxID=2613773 RepID=UPI001FED57A4|nr:plasmid partitioning protein RepB [Sinorhizobium sp. BG8]